MSRLLKKILGVLIFSSSVIFSQYHNIPSYKAYKTTIPIIVDGKINEPVWASADLIDNFVINTDNSPSPYKTEVRILYDDEFVYFALRCFDDNIWSTKTKRDDDLWEEEVIEIFICANPDESNYIELEVNPLGAIFDAYFLDSTKCMPFNSWNVSEFKVAVDIQGTIDGEPGDILWTCEIAFPIIDVVTAPSVPTKAGDIWYINLYRIEQQPKQVFLSWSPTYGDNFHSPSFFGKLIFTGNIVP